MCCTDLRLYSLSKRTFSYIYIFLLTSVWIKDVLEIPLWQDELKCLLDELLVWCKWDDPYSDDEKSLLLCTDWNKWNNYFLSVLRVWTEKYRSTWNYGTNNVFLFQKICIDDSWSEIHIIIFLVFKKTTLDNNPNKNILLKIKTKLLELTKYLISLFIRKLSLFNFLL